MSFVSNYHNEQPVGNMFEWHFTFLGAKGTPFEGGLYHGSISLPANYPKSGPSVRLLNPNQRFKVGLRSAAAVAESRSWVVGMVGMMVVVVVVESVSFRNHDWWRLMPCLTLNSHPRAHPH